MDSDDEYLARFDPHRDENGFVVENAEDYALRMRSTLLPNWPEQVLQDWLHRHAGGIDRYAFLGFENLEFSLEEWPVGRLPNHTQFSRVSSFDDDLDDVRRRANEGSWLAQFVLQNGTWSSPVVMFDNKARLEHPDGWPLMTPFHLLEGHNRMSFVLALRDAGLAKPSHHVWVARNDYPVRTSRLEGQ